ncbi:MAG TPA: alpha/beta hydrolase [Baekduia sp.]|nr:alpha/beta hydrolase [Baekduia sp.]
MTLNVVRAGEGTPVVLLHGLTATHRYVVMGSKNLERGGHQVIAYDARGHGASDPADSYSYDDLAADLRGVMDDAGIGRAVLAGASMGAHTALRFALEHPDRAAGLLVMTPGFDPDQVGDATVLARWDMLADALRTGGVDGFVEAYGPPSPDERWTKTLTTVLRQRMELHEHPLAVADALQQTPRSQPFAQLGDLGAIACPVTVVGTRDAPDPGHPLDLANRYAAALGTDLIVEEPGASPIAWQGGKVSALITTLAEAAEF